MEYAIVYSSKTGNTKLLAETIKDALSNDKCVYFGNPDDKALTVKRIYIGFWTDKGTCDESTAEFLKKLTDQEVYLFGTAGFGDNIKYFSKVLKRTERNISNDVNVIGRYMCQGKMPISVLKKYEDMEKRKLKIPGLKGMVENFKKALTHPDDKDLSILRESVLQ